MLLDADHETLTFQHRQLHGMYFVFGYSLWIKLNPLVQPSCDILRHLDLYANRMHELGRILHSIGHTVHGEARGYCSLAHG